MTNKILNFLRQLFGMRPSWQATPQPDEVDDPFYVVEEITEDDEEPRELLEYEEEPDAEVVEQIEREIVPLDTWLERQIALQELGFDPGRIDGKFGRHTQAALKAFQTAHHLASDGIWGPKTEAAITKALGQPPPPPALKPPGFYEDFLDPSEYVLDDAFYASFIDLTSVSNVTNVSGLRRRRGTRPFKNLTTNVWHQTAFFWRPYLELKAEKRYSGHHKINAHGCLDTDGSILLLHPLRAYLMTANHFNPVCLSWEIMGNFEGIFGTGDWYKPGKFGRGRPKRIQLIRARQLTLWLLDPEQGPPDDELPAPLLAWREECRIHGNPLKYVNAHRQGTDNRNLDSGSEPWYHVGQWSAIHTTLEVGPVVGNGRPLPKAWTDRPIAPPLSA